MSVLLVALGGALGTLARYGVAAASLRLLGPGLPWATLAVNVVGCLLLGALSEVFAKGHLSPDLRLALGTGFCGGLTTYSTFNSEALLLVKNGSALHGGGYVVVTVVLCALAGLAGMWSARAILT